MDAKSTMHDEWYGSPHNQLSAVGQPIRSVELHDVTLRDGEQHVGVVFTKEDKMEIATALAEMGVHRIEVANVAVSQEDREAIRAIVKANLGPKIFATGRAMKLDVDRALDCGVDRMAIGAMVNDQYLKAFGWTLDESLERIVTASKYAGEQGLRLTLSILDAARLSAERFLQVVDTVVKYGHVTSVSITDTFGLFSPVGVGNFLRRVMNQCPRPLEVHFHNDFGLGTANALTALSMGVETVHVSVNGLGERIGNTPLEELVMALEVLYDCRTGLNLKKLNAVSDRVQRISGVKMPTNKPVVGEGLRLIESGLVAAEYIRLTREDPQWGKWLAPFLPAAIGKAETDVVLGKMSGMANIERKLSEFGLTIGDEEKTRLVEMVKQNAIAEHRLLTDDEFVELARGINSLEEAT